MTPSMLERWMKFEWRYQFETSQLVGEFCSSKALSIKWKVIIKIVGVTHKQKNPHRVGSKPVKNYMNALKNRERKTWPSAIKNCGIPKIRPPPPIKITQCWLEQLFVGHSWYDLKIVLLSNQFRIQNTKAMQTRWSYVPPTVCHSLSLTLPPLCPQLTFSLRCGFFLSFCKYDFHLLSFSFLKLLFVRKGQG